MNNQTPHSNIASTLWTRLRNGRMSTTFALLGTLSIGILAGSMLTGSISAKEQKIDSTDARALVIPSPVSLGNGFSAIVKNVGPAVVNINTESLPKQQAAPKRGQRRGQQSPDGNGGDQGDMQDFFNRFFGGQIPGGGDGGGAASETRALGSGFIVDPRGYIITNNHVVDKADRIYVKLSTDPENDADPGRPATVIGVDRDTDIAVIKIDAKQPLPTVKLGNSEGAQVGDWVLAIGSPFGLNQTVSAGIVSAKNRSIGGADEAGFANSFQKFIQTDAAINPGNSGGPLVDMAGQVVGMNTAIYTQSAGSEGVGFAMPSNTVIRVYNDLISPTHKVTRGSIGITFQSAISPAVAREYGFTNGGVLVGSVTPNMPAAKAGLQPNDVITTVDGKPIKDGDELISVISDKKPGSTVRVGYTRNGKASIVDVGIIDRNKLNADLANAGSDDSPADDNTDVGQNKLGITVEPTKSALVTQLGIKGGVTVTDVRPGSFADEINLPRTAVITEINHKPVTDASSYRAVVGALKSGDDVVFVYRDPRVKGGGNSYVGGVLP